MIAPIVWFLAICPESFPWLPRVTALTYCSMQANRFMNQKLIPAFGALLLCSPTVCLGDRAIAIGFTPPPNQGAPSQSTGGASRGVLFRGQGAPQQSTGGASRGVMFNGQGTPQQATGGASRSVLFQGKGAPRQASGGASRGILFQSQGAPRQASGGASRSGKLFRPAKGQGTPRHTGGGASRRAHYEVSGAVNAAAGPGALAALLPPTYGGTTLSAHPMFLAYLPQSEPSLAMFSLKDADGNLVYQELFEVSGDAGVIAYELPPQAPGLEMGKSYQWYVALQVEGELTPSTPYVDGWITRIEPSAPVAAALQGQDPMKQAEVLGENGIWYDCAAKVAALRVAQPNRSEFETAWAELLGSVQLQDMAEVPMLTSYSVQ
jgi:hypothetical protein